MITPSPSPAREHTTEDHSTACHHCGLPCPDRTQTLGHRVFCCAGCRTVCELLEEHGLNQFYDLADAPGAQPDASRHDYAYLDDEALRARLLDFTDGKTSRVTLHIPAIHCVACVWLLENLYRLQPGIGRSQVNFPRKETAITFDETKTSLGRVVGLLSSLGYEPVLRLSDAGQAAVGNPHRALLQKLGLAGFCFGNIMLLSLSSYLGLDVTTGPAFATYFGIVSLLLSVPVLLYSASDYWHAAFVALRQRVLTIDVPIAIGIVALFTQSVGEIATRTGEGYLDSFTGLIFFLLCGKWFQQRTYQTLSFDHDYRSYFPLSVVRRGSDGDARIPVTQLTVGDRIVVRNQELLPADAVLIEGDALIDFSFVTGEAEPVPKAAGDYLYAGGRQVGGAIELEVVKDVSQSYLTSLWNSNAFHQSAAHTVIGLTDRISKTFTLTVIGIALTAAAAWCAIDPSRAVLVFSSVLIVACPCALALSAPFALGTALRILGRNRCYLRNAETVEALAHIDTIVFDKTGTLTHSGPGAVTYQGTPLSEADQAAVKALTGHSTHPHSTRIHDFFDAKHVDSKGFREAPGAGIEGEVDGRHYRIGSRTWVSPARSAAPQEALPEQPPGPETRLPRGCGFQPQSLSADGISVPQEVTSASDAVERCSAPFPEAEVTAQSTVPQDAASENRSPDATSPQVHLAVDGAYRGVFELGAVYRPELPDVLDHLRATYHLALLSGDQPREQHRLRELLGPDAPLAFGRDPHEKLAFVEELQRRDRTVLMIGDGLNDAGALKQGNVGITVTEDISAFSPACDGILDASAFSHIPTFLRFSRSTLRTIKISFLISLLYNIIGISFAVRGLLSPVVAAILMPVSSVSVVTFAVITTEWKAKRLRLR